MGVSNCFSKLVSPHYPPAFNPFQCQQDKHTNYNLIEQRRRSCQSKIDNLTMSYDLRTISPALSARTLKSGSSSLLSIYL